MSTEKIQMGIRAEDTFAAGAQLRGENLRKSLKKSHYWFTYELATQSGELSVNHGHGGEPLLKLTGIGPETAEKFATSLGLIADGNDWRSTRLWSKWNPSYVLEHDGSLEADDLLSSIYFSGIPCRVVRGCSRLAILAHSARHACVMIEDRERVREIIRQDMERYREQLESTP